MTTNMRKQLGQRIQRIRKSKGLSQEKLAEMLDISINALSNVETGRSFMGLPNIEKLIDVFDIYPYELFIFDKEPGEDVIYDDLIKKIELLKDNRKKLFILSEIVDKLT